MRLGLVCLLWYRIQNPSTRKELLSDRGGLQCLASLTSEVSALIGSYLRYVNCLVGIISQNARANCRPHDRLIRSLAPM